MVVDLSVVIITWNQANKLEACLKSIFSQKINCKYEIIIVNNNSTDRTKDILNKFKNKLIIIQNSENRGVAPARNQGIKISKGRLVMMLDDDTEVLKNCFDNIAEFMDLHNDSWCAGTKQCKPDGSLEHNARRFYTIGSIIFRRTLFGDFFPNAKIIREHLYLDADYDKDFAVDWVAGAGFIMRREAVNKLGCFDENYFFGFEDVDWCYKVKLAGMKTYYIHIAEIIHYVKGSSRKLFSAKSFYHLMSALRFWKKYMWQ